MNEFEKQERLLDLLTERASYGLSKENEKELEDLLKLFPEWKDDETLALTAAAINLSAVPLEPEMPAHLKNKILADSEKYFAEAAKADGKVLPFESEKRRAPAVETESAGFLENLLKSNWLGWAVAGAACIALALNLWLTRPLQNQVVQNPPPQITPSPTPGLAQQREQLIASAPDVVRNSWSDFDPKKPFGVEGDVVWSNSQQKGFIRFRNLPVNDKSRETYQLWVFDATQKHPVDGGVFDADANGEIIIPIDAKIRVEKPTMFAVTAEKPGGVVVSELGKVMAVAKV